jgi:NAD(P)H-dependent flavin oxidoreductase YrpB (nitropropane dioxygenase family)
VESPIHQNIKETMVNATEKDTVHIFRTLRNTARVYKNAVSLKVVELERRPGGAKFEELRDLVSGARGRVVFENGDKDHGIWSASVVLGLIKDIPTCKALIDRMVMDAEEVIDTMSNLKVIKPKL